jgi:hypothetical protein
MSEKKMGPREQQLREMREQREQERLASVKSNKAKIDKVVELKAKGIGKVMSLKARKK